MTSINTVEGNKAIIDYLIGLSDQLDSAECKIEADVLECKTQIAETREMLQLLRNTYQTTSLQQSFCQQSSFNNQQIMDSNLQQQTLQEIGSNDDVGFILNQQYGIDQALSASQQQSNLLLLQQDTPLSLESFNLMDFPLDANSKYASALFPYSSEPSTITGTELISSPYDMNIHQNLVPNSPSSTIFQLSQYNPIESLDVMNYYQQKSSMCITLPPLMSFLEQRKKRRMQYKQSATTRTGTSNSAEDDLAKFSGNSPIVYHQLQNQGISNPEGSQVAYSYQSNSSHFYSDYPSTPISQGKQQLVNGSAHIRPSDSSGVTTDDEALQNQERQVSPLDESVAESSISGEHSEVSSTLFKAPRKESCQKMLSEVQQFIKLCYSGTEQDCNACFEDLQKLAKTICGNYASEPEHESHLLTWSRLPSKVKSELHESLEADVVVKYLELVKKARCCEGDWFFAFIIQAFWSRRSSNLRAKASRGLPSSRSSAQTKQSNSTLSPPASANDSDNDEQINRAAIKKEKPEEQD